MKKRNLLKSLGAAFVFGFMTSATAQTTFHHPGLMHSQADFDRIQQRIQAGDEAAIQSVANLRMAGPVLGDHGHNWAVNVDISRGIAGAENYMNAYRNCARAYQCALLWKITGERRYGDVAVSILNDYANINKSLSGNTNISLIPAFNGYQFLNAAEIMRDYDGWAKADFEKFKQYMIDVWFVVAQDFLERRHDTAEREQNWYHYYSNWGVGNELFCISLGIFCDLPDIYNYGMYWLTEGPGNESVFVGHHAGPYALEMCGEGWGLMPWFHADNRAPLGYYAQMQESGRDQGHAQASLGLLGSALQTCYNQGDNLFCNMWNPIVPGLAGSAAAAGAAEYVAAYNDGVDNLPYKLNWWMGDFGPNSRGQWRPIWQVFINAYENRMGIPMPYCHNMHNRMGLEWGGGNYGNNSGGYDHTGWGDLMFNDEPVASTDMAPTVLYPTITGPTLHPRGAAADMTMRTHHTGWVSAVTPGTEVTMEVNLPEGEEDTGNWLWEDGATGKKRIVKADHSALYRVTYTNAKGIKSTQLFSIAVRGEGIKATLDGTITYRGTVFNDNTISMGKGTSAILTTVYHNWNYIESEEWFDEEGNRLATGGSYTFRMNEDKDRTITFVLTNQSGVKIEKEFLLKYDSTDVSHLLPDQNCANIAAWDRTTTKVIVTKTDIAGFSNGYVTYHADANASSKAGWGLPVFSATQKATDLTPGKYSLSANMVAAQESRIGEGQKTGVDGVFFTCNGLNAPVATRADAAQNYTLEVYVAEDGVLTLGFKNVTNQNVAYSRCGANFVAIDELKLCYLGTADIENDLASLKAKAQNLLSLGASALPSGIYNNLNANLNAQATIDGVKKLGEVVNNAEMAVRVYATFLEECNKMTAVSGLPEAVTQAATAMKAASTVDELYAQHDALLAAWKEALPTMDVANVDMTMFIHNSSLSTVSADFIDNTIRWMSDVEGGNFRVLPINGSDTQRGDAKGENMIERWTGEAFPSNKALVYDMLNDAPAGIYTFTAAAQRGSDMGKINIFVGTGLTSMTMTQAEIATTAILKNVSVTSTTSNGKLAFGLVSATGNSSQWVSMADMHLTFQSAQNGLRAAIAQAEALLNEGGEDVGGKLAAAVASAKTALESDSKVSVLLTQYKTLISQIKTFIQNNDSSVIDEALALCDDLMIIATGSIETTEGAKQTFIDAIESARTQLETMRDPAKIETLMKNLEKARQAYVVKAMPTGGLEFDYTFLVKNADCSSTTGGWLTDGTGNFQRMSNSAVSGEYESGYFWEKWDIESYYFKENDRPVYQTLTALQNGNYHLHLAAFRKNEFNTKQVNPGSMYVFLNNQKVEVTSEVLNYYDVTGASTDGNVTFGLKAGKNCNANWEALADVHLYYLGDPTVGIRSIEASGSSSYDNTPAVWYDLQGRQIAEPTKSGIYIYKGKKIVK